MKHMTNIHGILGNASEKDINEVKSEVDGILIEAEVIEHAYKLIRDLLIFTNKRLILVDKQGITGKKAEFLSIPYASISYFSIESAGHFDLDSDMKIGVRSGPTIIKKFRRDSQIENVQKTLARYIL